MDETFIEDETNKLKTMNYLNDFNNILQSKSDFLNNEDDNDY